MTDLSPERIAELREIAESPDADGFCYRLPVDDLDALLSQAGEAERLRAIIRKICTEACSRENGQIGRIRTLVLEGLSSQEKKP